MKAVVLLSGGLDSTICMSIAAKEGYELYPISFEYGQRHKRELECAKNVAKHYNVKKHLVIKTNMNDIGGNALTGDMEVPEGDADREDIPVTYVPARNLLFLSYALGYAEVLRAEKIFIGVNAVDYSGYPDCRPEFINQFQGIANYLIDATTHGKLNVKIETPLLNISKGEIVKLGKANGAPLELTTSCYKGGEKACGECDSCVLRLKGFREAGYEDPIPYEKR